MGVLFLGKLDGKRKIAYNLYGVCRHISKWSNYTMPEHDVIDEVENAKLIKAVSDQYDFELVIDDERTIEFNMEDIGNIRTVLYSAELSL